MRLLRWIDGLLQQCGLSTEHAPRRSGIAVVLGSAAWLAGCGEPAAPERMTPYPFTLIGTGEVFHWPSDRLPVRYFAVDDGNLRELTARAIEVWQSQFLYGEYEGMLVSDSAGADVVVRIEGGAPPPAPVTDDPPVLACKGATTYPPRSADRRLQGRLTVSVEWFDDHSPTDIANCLVRVVTHEMGHTLGLLQHSSDDRDLMFASPMVPVPSAADRATAQTLYHTPSDLRPWDGSP